MGPSGDLDRMLQVGQRYPYTPPSGLVLAAWLDDDGIEEWLACSTCARSSTRPASSGS